MKVKTAMNHTIKLLLPVSILFVSTIQLQAEESTLQMQETVSGQKLDYLLQSPTGKPPTNAGWPLLLFLHGYGECGNDIRKVKTHGPPPSWPPGLIY